MSVRPRVVRSSEERTAWRPRGALWWGGWIALGVSTAARSAEAQDYAGNYRIVADGTTAEVPEWGPDCGQRPESHRGSTGRQVRVSADGSNLVIEDRPRMRTDGCWSQNPQVRRVSGGGGNGRWTVQCATSPTDYQHEDGTYTTTIEGDRMTLRDRTVYRWQLRTSNCRATLTRVMTYERIATTTAAQDAAVSIVRPAAQDASTRPQPRCAVPGPAARLAIVSGARAASAGARVCFRAQLQDASGCPAINGANAVVTWNVTRRGGPTPPGEGGCVTIAQGVPPGTEFLVAASAGGLEEQVTLRVVSASEPREAITEILAEDAGGLEIQGPTEAQNTVGAVRSGGLPVAPQDTSRNVAVAALAALAALALAAAVFVLRRSRHPAGTGPRDASSVTNEPLAAGSHAAGSHAAGSHAASSHAAGSHAAGSYAAGSLAAGSHAAGSLAAGSSARDAETTPRTPSVSEGASPPTPPAGAPNVALTPRPVDPRETRSPLAQTMIGAMPSPETRAVPEKHEPLRAPTGGSTSPPASAQGPSTRATAPRETRRCPVCDLRFSHENAFCPEHGVALVALDASAPGALAGPATGAPSARAVAEQTTLRCPRCGRGYGPGHVFCGEDGARLEPR
jgi:hypothetical protein